RIEGGHHGRLGHLRPDRGHSDDERQTRERQPPPEPVSHWSPLLWTWISGADWLPKCPSRIQLIEYRYMMSLESEVCRLPPLAWPSSCVTIDRTTCWNVAWG